MRCQESSRKTPKCNCCELCVQVQNAKSQKDNSAPERISLQTTGDSYFKNFAIPDDLYNCEENINRVKSYNERALKVLDNLRQRACRILESSDLKGPSEDEEEEEELEEQEQQHQPCQQQNRSHHSHFQQQSTSQQQQQHASQQQHQSCLQGNKSHPSHLQQHSRLHQSHKQKQPSHLQLQGQFYQQEQCKPKTHGNSKSQDSSPSGRVQNLGYLPKSNFLRRMQRRAESNPNPITRPLTQCGCENCFPDGICYQTQFTCRCCRCNATGHGAQTMPCGGLHVRERKGPYSDVSSMHDPCMCFRTWRPSPCAGHFPEYPCEILESEDDICAGEAYIQDRLNDGYDGCEDKAQSKKKGKSGHVSRVDKKRRRSGRRKSKPNEKECLPPEIDFSPSLKRPHPNSCERCWRYASPSRSPVNRPSQRFDPNYRRSHSEVNINSDSKGNISKSGSHYSSTNCVEFDPETKVHEVISSVDRSPTRIKSADNVKKPSPLTPTCHKPRRRTPKTKDDTDKSRTKKEESDVASTQKPNCKNQRSFGSSAERSKDILRGERQNPMPCSPSMFDKKSQRSNSKNPSCNRLSSSESCKENVRIRQRPSSACQIQTSEDRFDKPRAQSFDRNYLNEIVYIPPERVRKCYCTKPKTRTVNMNVTCEHPLLCQGGRDCFPEVRGPFGMSNNRENPFGLDKICPGPDATNPLFDIRPCIFSLNDPAQAKFMERLPRCCCQGGPVTLWDRRVVPKQEGEAVKKGNEGKARNKNRKDEESNPRKYCVFYMNKSEENDKDGVEVLVEELTEGRKGKDPKSEFLKNKTKKAQETRSDSMALRFQKGIAEKCRRRENDRDLYF